MDANIHPLLQHAAEVTHGQEHADAVPDVDREQLDEYRPPTQIADRRLEGTDVELHDGASIMGEIVKTCGSGFSGDVRSGLLSGVFVRLRRGDVGGTFEQFAFVEDGAGAHQGDQVRGVDGSPAGLCCVDQLVGHGNTGCP